MRIALNGVIVKMQPDSIDWSRPNYGTNGDGTPVVGPYYSCTLGFSRTTLVQFEEWFRYYRQTVDIHLPHPKTGLLTEATDAVIYSIEQSMSAMDPCIAAARGVDIVVTRVEVD